jgi:hypothetical protein
MFCDGCGGAVQPGQGFCSRCGKQIVGPVSLMQPVPGRVQEHIHLLGILWLGLSAFNALGGVAVYIIGNTIFAHGGSGGGAPAFLRPLLTAVSVLLFGKAAIGFLGGWGAMQREVWARPLLLVLAFISLFTNVPFGTALGVYTMWVLLPSQSQKEYERLAEARAA